MSTLQTASPTIALDIGTLTAVRREVAARENDWRASWRTNEHHHTADPRLVVADALRSLGNWIDDQIADADGVCGLDSTMSRAL